MKSDISPRVSIVITVYNYERYVGAAIQSALAQTLPALEIVVVDDGSTDNTASVLASFGDRITVIGQENQGQIAAISRGYEASRGEIVLFLDADDVLRPTALAAVVDVWSPHCAKVQFELDIIDGAGASLGRRFCNYVQPYGAAEIRREFDRFATYAWPVLTGNAYSRWFLQLHMPLQVPMGPDGFLNTIAPLYGEVEVVAEPLASYRLHNANMSYHQSAGDRIGTRFAKQVSFRTNELRLLADHAERCGVRLPRGDLLDHDLTFVNYRLMLKALGEDYEGAVSDSSLRLWRVGFALLFRRPLPAKLKFAHAVWLTALMLSPRWLAFRLITFRFNRAQVLQPIRRWLTRLPAIASRSEVARRHDAV